MRLSPHVINHLSHSSTPLERSVTRPHQPGILIYLDNDPDDLFFFARALRKHGHKGQFKPCRRIEDLQEICRTSGTKIDAILLDFKLDGCTGLDALNWIKSQPHLHSVPCYMISSGRFGDEINRALESGAEAYFFKPQQLEGWNDVVQAILPPEESSLGSRGFSSYALPQRPRIETVLAASI